jgi:hypothetical protein
MNFRLYEHYELACAKHKTVRLACLRHAASVHPEPGSNSQKNLTELNFCSPR